MVIGQLSIRVESKLDYSAVARIIEKAFESVAISNHTEHLLVNRLRTSDAFIPELALVAELDKRIVGYILLTKIKIVNPSQTFDSLALAPVCVLPQYQRHGIGAMLMKTAHKKARNLGYQSIALLGHENYYPRFGYIQADSYNIEFPFDAPKKNCMIKELTENGLENVNGKVVYPKEFFQ